MDFHGAESFERGHPRGGTTPKANQNRSWIGEAMTTWQRWYWLLGGREAKLRYYATLTKTAAGRARLNEYKVWRRRCVRAGIWPSIKDRKARV
jgi:hypothetical protein